MKDILRRVFLLTPLLFLPLIANASDSDSSMLSFAVIWVLFETLHWSFGIFKPLGSILDSKFNLKGSFWIFFVLRAAILIVIIPIYPEAFILDFFGLFVGAFAMAFIEMFVKMKEGGTDMGIVTVNNGKIICPKCGKEMAVGNTRCTSCGTDLKAQPLICPKCKTENLQTSRFCKSCGGPLESNVPVGFLGDTLSEPKQCPKCKKEITVVSKFCPSCGENVEKLMGRIQIPIPKASAGTPVNRTAFDNQLITGTEDEAIKYLVQKELSKDPSYKGKTLATIETKKIIMTLIYVVLLFILLSIYMAYHTYLFLGIVIITVMTIIYFKVTMNFKIEKYIEKEIQKRPDEKISYITSSILSGATSSKALSRVFSLIMFIVAIGSFVLLFKEPHLIYENYAGEKALRYYTYGIFNNPKELTIPSNVEGKKVLGIRGDVFKNVKTIEKVTLPNTIQEIRGGAFQNCVNLKEINLPEGLDEIHGDTFNGCSSLETIVIPEGVSRIGGSAFRNCIRLSNVTIPKSVTEIGSSAFRNTNIGKVCISESAYVNERAFKETYPVITYYENDCEVVSYYNEDDYDDYY